MDGEFPADWADLAGLPERTRGLLLMGGTGRPHLLLAGRTALSEVGTQSRKTLALDLFLAAFEASPLDGELARFVLDLMARLGPAVADVASKKTMALLRASAARSAPVNDPAGLAELGRLAGPRDLQGLVAFLGERVRREPGVLFWRGHLLDVAYLLGDWTTVLEVLDLPWPPGFDLVRFRVSGDVFFQRGDYEKAAQGYAQAGPLRPALWRLAECLTRLDGGALSDRTLAAWRAACDAAWWNVGPVLRLHDRLAGLDRPGPRLPGRVAVCLYTYNHAPELDAALAALFASDLSGAEVTALDNASGDDTRAVLSAWRERTGERLSVVTLPVNIGAPAARNWLASLPSVAKAGHVAYLDDDAQVPPDWLAFFGAAVRAFPGAGVYGCRVVDLACPGRIQHADLHLLEPEQDQTPVFSAICTQDLDFGQFGYLRPAASVTGCCHLFRTEALRESGPFDIRFSPTQYDDLDHDLRFVASGSPPVYQGHLRVLHARLSAALSLPDRAAMANSRGNLAKLGGKYPPQALAAMRRTMEDALEEDYRKKRVVVDEALGRTQAQ